MGNVGQSPIGQPPNYQVGIALCSYVTGTMPPAKDTQNKYVIAFLDIGFGFSSSSFCEMAHCVLSEYLCAIAVFVGGGVCAWTHLGTVGSVYAFNAVGDRANMTRFRSCSGTYGSKSTERMMQFSRLNFLDDGCGGRVCVEVSLG